MANDLRILSVGCDVAVASRSVSWTEEYNIKDYDRVFFDVHTLDNLVSDSTISEKLGDHVYHPSLSNIYKAIANGTKIIIFVGERKNIPHDKHTYFSVNSLIPGGVNFVQESGRSVNKDSISQGWEWYFSGQFYWNIHFTNDVKDYSGGNTPAYANIESLVENGANEPLAGAIRYLVKDSQSSALTNLPGYIILLPVIQDWETEDLIDRIIHQFTNIDTQVNTGDFPEWVENWRMSSEDELISEIDELKRRKSEIEDNIAEKKDQREEYDRYKVLLYGNAGALENLVPEIFAEMNFDVEGEDRHGKDGLVNIGDTSYVMEITGTKNAISDDKCRQLSTWVDEMEIENDSEKNYSGLLVANPHRLKPPQERELNDYLPPHLQDFLEKRGYHLLLTTDLYNIFSDYIDGKLERSDIVSKFDTDELVIDSCSGSDP